jgi:CheY-like chemotaxis protein
MAIRSPDKKPAQKPARRSTAVYVEDDAAAISVARAVLAQRNLALAVAADMEQACSLARRKPPEVILVNLDLAALGAARLIHLLRENPATQAAPVLAVGKDAAPEAAIKALEAGFFQYLVAPLDAGQLTEALDYALEFSALERTEL